MMQIYLSVSTIEHKLIRESIFLRLSITLFRESHQVKKKRKKNKFIYFF